MRDGASESFGRARSLEAGVGGCRYDSPLPDLSEHTREDDSGRYSFGIIVCTKDIRMSAIASVDRQTVVGKEAVCTTSI